jgi:hypothetical protein
LDGIVQLPSSGGDAAEAAIALFGLTAVPDAFWVGLPDVRVQSTAAIKAMRMTAAINPIRIRRIVSPNTQTSSTQFGLKQPPALEVSWRGAGSKI